MMLMEAIYACMEPIFVPCPVCHGRAYLCGP